MNSFTPYTDVSSFSPSGFFLDTCTFKAGCVHSYSYFSIKKNLLLQNLPSRQRKFSFSQSHSCKQWLFFISKFITAFLGSHLAMLMVVAVLSVSLNNKNRFLFIVKVHSRTDVLFALPLFLFFFCFANSFSRFFTVSSENLSCCDLSTL